ncbi:RHS repeat-associated core domain-containing protein, partial [Elizabethkingia anophelis]|uniref:RHS repeat-associated core domain-containing protein n=2 Tax=Elizabethkingia anophelis TaxID=1117645 RepID=UPI0028891E01
YTKGASGGAEIIEENNYYPFGLKHQGYNSSSLANSAYQYKYNGKELQETGIYAMDFRNYIPDTGRFLGIDKLSEIMPDWTPFRFAFNNPLYFSDPTGLYEDDFLAYQNNAMSNKFFWPNAPGTKKNEVHEDEDGRFIWDGTMWKDSNGIGVSYKTKDIQGVQVFGKQASFNSYSSTATWATGTLASFMEVKGDLNSLTLYNQGIRKGLNNTNYTLVGRNARLFKNVPMTDATAPFSKMTKYGKTLGKAGFVVGVITDSYGVIKFVNDPQSSDAVHPAKGAINTGMGVWGLLGGPPGVIVSTVYTTIDTFYPGGWVGASETAARTEAHEQATTGHPFFSNSAIKL